MIYKKLDINPLDQKLVLGSKTLCEYKLLSEYTNSDSIRIILSTKTFANKKDPKPKASTEGAGADAKAPKNIPVVDKALLFEEVRSAILFRVKDRDLSEKVFSHLLSSTRLSCFPVLTNIFSCAAL